MSSINYYTNFLNLNLIETIEDHAKKNIMSAKWQTSLFWAPNIKHRSALVAVLPLSGHKKICEQLRPYYSKLIPKTKKLYMEVNYYIWPPLSYIPFHNDGNKEIASTVYLNREWQIDNGGLFLYKQDDKFYAIPPTFNSCVINNNAVQHSTTLTTTDAPNRTTLQIFFYEK